MPRDLKYGEVTLEHKPDSLTDDEPVIVFRAQDGITKHLLHQYREDCVQAGCTRAHIDMVDAAANRFEEWQDENPERVKIPDAA
jgi:hypothetical protein